MKRSTRTIVFIVTLALTVVGLKAIRHHYGCGPYQGTHCGANTGCERDGMKSWQCK